MTQTTDTLEVFLHGEPVGVLRKGKKHGSATFQYYPDAPYALSISMPLRELPYDPVTTRNWFTGLLPEGERPNFLAKHFVVSLTDYVDLLRETGLDCSGAVTFGVPSIVTSSGSVAATNFAEVIAALPEVHDGAESDSLRSIVAGFQPKTTALRHIGWNISNQYSMTTHIAKPEHERYPGLADAEAWAMTAVSGVAKTAYVKVEDFNGIRTIIVTRFDRFVYDGEAHAVHQEDFCQALGLSGDRKYAAPGGSGKKDPSLVRLAALLKEHADDPDRELQELVRQMTVNVVMGNTDWHAKNVGLIHDVNGRVSLAPLYDVVPVIHYIPKGLMSMSINSKFRPDRIYFHDLVSEAEHWGIDSETAECLVRSAVDGVAEGIAEAETAYPLRPLGVLNLATSQLRRFGVEGN